MPTSELLHRHDQDVPRSSAQPEEAAAVDEHKHIAEHTATQPLVEHASPDVNLKELEIAYQLRSPSNDTHHLASSDADVEIEDMGGPDSTDIDPLLPKEEEATLADDGDDILVKIDIPEGHSPLTTKPLVLTSTILIIVLVFNLICVISMITILLLSGKNRKFYTSHPNIQFVIRYVPSVVGTVTTLITRSMYYAFSRLEFYISMADSSSDADANSGQSKGSVMRPYASSELPSLADWFRHLREWAPRHPRYWLWAIINTNSILISFVTSFKSTFLLASSSPSPTNPNAWTVAVSPVSTSILIFLYAFNTMFIISLLIHLWSRCTGLKWNPVTIADHLALFHESNILRDFEVLEKDLSAKSRELLRHKEYRIGYWEKGRDRRVVYGIGRETGSSASPSTNESAEEVKDNNIIAERATGNKTHLPFCTCPQEYDSPKDPHSKNSFYLPWLVWFWWIVNIVCVIVCITALLQGAVEKGFKLPNSWWKIFPHIFNNSVKSSSRNPPTNTTFNPSNILNSSSLNVTFTGVFGDDPMANDLFLYVFVFRNILVFLSSIFAIGFLQSIDLGHRFSQPFANMARSDTSATDSILLNYLWGTPGVVTIDALMNSHWQVAWFSLLNLISSPFPTFVAGLFTITNTGLWIVFDIHQTSLYFVLVYLILYASTLPFAWPRRDRRLPRSFTCIADLASLFYASHVLKNSALDISRANVTQRHLEAKLFLQEETYSVGLYTGSDGKRHFGFDTAYLKDSTGKIVEHVQHLSKWPEDKTKILSNRV